MKENELKKILTEKGLSVAKASELVGIPNITMTNLVYVQDDLKQIKVDTLIKLCIGLNVKAIDLFPEEEKEKVLRLSRRSRKKVR